MKYLIFSFFRSGGEAKRGIEFRHSTGNTYRTQRKVGNGVSKHKVPSDYRAICGIQRKADLILIYNMLSMYIDTAI